MDYELVDKLLAERGMSRRQLAIAAGISINNMSGWFRRKTKKVPFESSQAIANVLGVDWMAIVGIDRYEGDEGPQIEVGMSWYAAQGLTVSNPSEGYKYADLIHDFKALSLQSKTYILHEMGRLLTQERNGRNGNNGKGT